MIVTVALLGLPRAAPPVALVRFTVKVLLPVKAVVLIGTEKVFEAALPAVHCRVPFVAV